MARTWCSCSTTSSPNEASSRPPAAHLARAVRTPDSSRRTRRLCLAALSAVAFGAAVIGYGLVISDDMVSTPGLLLPSVLGIAALTAAVWFLVAGLLTPRSQQPGYAGR